MHILVVNDDGPPSNKSSPYVHSLVTTLQTRGHTISVILPDGQRSWIGRAHMIGQNLTPSYFRPGSLHQDDGTTSSSPFVDGGEQWVLIDGTPASCVQIGLHHFFKDRGPVDLVLSGPNYGRNTTALFALSSGTLGGALEGAMCGKKSIALSYAFDSQEHDPKIIAGASRMATKLVEKFMKDWPQDVDVYSINVPLRENVESTKILYTNMLQNKWPSGCSYKEISDDEKTHGDPDYEEQAIREGIKAKKGNDDTDLRTSQVKYRWAPKFQDIMTGMKDSGSGDGWAVAQGYISVTPLRANFWHASAYQGEIKLAPETSPSMTVSVRPHEPVHAIVDHPDPYVQPLIVRALSNHSSAFPHILLPGTSPISAPQPTLTTRLLFISSYETLPFTQALSHPTTTLISSYIIRKALIRKHFLSLTISTWLVKHPNSILSTHFKPCVHFELDYAEFLDDALAEAEAWDLTESMERNESVGKQGKAGEIENGEKEWWILKPGMSDGGNGIRLFSTVEELRVIFEEWEEGDENDDDEDCDNQDEEDEIENYDKPAAIDETSDHNDYERPSGTVGNGGGGAMTSQLRHFIAQPYITPPLLLPSFSNRKFHIRAYALAVGSLRVYVYREMLALFAAHPYQQPSSSDSASSTTDPASNVDSLNLARHLTNTCFQDESTRASSVHRFWNLPVSTGTGTSTSLLPSRWQDDVFEQICAVTGEVFEAAAREQMVHFQTLPNAFEVFGVDFLVDAHLNVWLLELNAFPDFKQTGDQFKDVVVGALWDAVVEVAVVPFFDNSSDETQRLTRGNERMRLVREIDLGR